jgi:hypothetical protein
MVTDPQPSEALRAVKKSMAEIRHARFVEQGGLCYYCKAPMVEDFACGKRRVPANLCTLEHLICRLDPKRWDENRPDSPRRYAAACAACNHQRAAWCQQHTPKELLNRLSKKRNTQTAREVVLEYYLTHPYIEPPPYVPGCGLEGGTLREHPAFGPRQDPRTPRVAESVRV